jgi:hypothetical protein
VVVSPDVITLRVPDSLGDGVRDVEALYALADEGRPAKGFILDMGGVGFMKPYGVVALLVTTRRLSALSGRRVELTEEWAELELLPEWPEQVEYERIRPAVVFGGAVAKRSRQIKTPETTLRRWIANFETEGIRGLFESERAEGKSPLDPETRGFILNLKAEYFPMRDNEIATICYVRFGKRPHGRTVRRVLEANPTAMRMFRRCKPNNEIEDLVERKLAIVTLHSEG